MTPLLKGHGDSRYNILQQLRAPIAKGQDTPVLGPPDLRGLNKGTNLLLFFFSRGVPSQPKKKR